MRLGVYTVHAPLGIAPAPERLIFVREGFSLFAFILPFAYLAFHRVWWPLTAYIVIATGLELLAHQLGFGQVIVTALAVLVSLYVGLEAAALRQRALSRRGFLHVASVVAGSRIEAEQRYFSAADTLRPLGKS